MKAALGLETKTENGSIPLIGEAFLEANSRWKAENAEGLTDEDYLAQTEANAEAVTGVSWCADHYAPPPFSAARESREPVGSVQLHLDAEAPAMKG